MVKKEFKRKNDMVDSKDCEHNLLRVVHDNFKWILRLEHYAEKVRKHEQKRLLSKYGVPEPSQRWPPTRKK